MAKMPGWIRVRKLFVKDGNLMTEISINWWHPVAWFMLVKEIVERIVHGSQEG